MNEDLIKNDTRFSPLLQVQRIRPETPGWSVSAKNQHEHGRDHANPAAGRALGGGFAIYHSRRFYARTDCCNRLEEECLIDKEAFISACQDYMQDIDPSFIF
jgi:hypothetical protein